MPRFTGKHAAFTRGRLQSEPIATEVRMARIARLPTVLLAVLLPVTALAAPQDYALDPVHTRIVFFIDHAGLSQAIGTFSGITGRLRFDPEDWSTARVEAHIPVARLDMGDADWNRQMLGRQFFDAARHPEAHFVSTSVEPLGDGRARVTGQLRVRDVSRQITLDVTLNALKRHPMTHRPSAGFSASGTLLRQELGLLAFPTVIGNRVDLRIEAEAIRVRDAGFDDTDEAETDP